MRTDLILEDTTLRDGEQAPGVAFDLPTKLRILDLLVAAGVRWVEAGIPAMGGEELDSVKAMLGRHDGVRLVAWNRGVKEDVQQSLDLGFTAVHIGLPASTIHLEKSLRKDRSWLLERARELISYAKDRGAFVSISAEDIGRSEISFLQEYAGVVHAAGADRLRLSDTIGILRPDQYAERVRKVGEAAPIDTQCHAHNDFGLAVANTLAGLEAGARYFHVTVNAIGERAGMPDLAQTALALKQLYDRDLGLDLTKLPALSEAVAQASKAPLPPWTPVLGANVFSHESGIHTNGMLRDSATFEPFAPELLGQERKLVIGKHSGRAHLEAVLKEQGHEPTPDELSRLLESVRKEAIRRGSALQPSDLVDLYAPAG